MKKKSVHIKWTYEKLALEALKYDKKANFIKNSSGAYQTAKNRKILDSICNHMKTERTKWTYDLLLKEALKYKTKSEFQKSNSSAYLTALHRNILSEICKHMPKHVDQSGENNPRSVWTMESLLNVALKYNTRTSFQKLNSAAYASATRKKILNIICSHMKKSCNVSFAECQLLNKIKEIYPSAQIYRDTKVSILNKSHIKKFEIDIYIPELRKGIEFDGKFYHSFNGLKRSRPNWPNSDLKNYHQIKDDYFKSKGIEILHIKEKDWIMNKNFCVNKCLNFLRDK